MKKKRKGFEFSFQPNNIMPVLVDLEADLMYNKNACCFEVELENPFV
jgi:hypothetical protein